MPRVQKTVAEDDVRGRGADVSRTELLEQPSGTRDNFKGLVAVSKQVGVSPIARGKHVSHVVCVKEPDELSASLRRNEF